MGIGRVAGARNDHLLGRLWKIGEIFVAFVALDLGARRIDREDLALEAELVEVMHRPTADLVGIFRCADDGDGAWIKRGPETAHDFVLVTSNDTVRKLGPAPAQSTGPFRHSGMRLLAQTRNLEILPCAIAH